MNGLKCSVPRSGDCQAAAVTDRRRGRNLNALSCESIDLRCLKMVAQRSLLKHAPQPPHNTRPLIACTQNCRRSKSRQTNAQKRFLPSEADDCWLPSVQRQVTEPFLRLPPNENAKYDLNCARTSSLERENIRKINERAALYDYYYS